MSLREYRRKRRFDRTPEPDAAVVDASQRQPIFVVQLHHASSRHYDFRLEADGVLKSWAVPKGPSLRAGEKRLAVQVEDHPVSYATFAGDIPEGHYGAGHVDVFDHGTWTCTGDPRQALAAGKLDFVLHGERLNGGWTLVRAALRGKQPQWLLIKRGDVHAADREADDLVDAASSAARATPSTADRRTATAGARPRGTAAARAARPRARKAAAAAAATRAKAGAGAPWHARALALDGARDAPCPTGLRAQLTTLRDQAPAGGQWLHEIKWDGYRLLADLQQGRAQLRSRNDQAWTGRSAEVAQAVEALPVADARLDGELVVIDAEGRSDFSALQRVLEGSSPQRLRYLVFDLLGVAGVDLRSVPLLQRKQLLRDLLGREPGMLAYGEHVIGQGPAVFAASADKGYEGIVSKRGDAPYHDGRGTDWIKAKHEHGDEFVVAGYTDPKGARSGFGSLLLARRQAGGLRYVGRVGTGFDAAALARMSARLAALQVDTAGVELPAHVPFPRRSVHWVEPVLIAEVAFRGCWAKEGLLRQAAFKRLREDKPVADLGSDRADTRPAGAIPTPRDRPVRPGPRWRAAPAAPGVHGGSR